jgi:protein-disulfide isomerase
LKSRTLIRNVLVVLLATITLPAFAAAPDKDAFVQSVLHDPDAPVAGNPNGDVTIVAFLDYNCPFCRRSTPELDRFIASDPGVRVVYKDWPILAASSVLEAKVAIASKYQGKYVQAHDALMAIKARPATDEAVKVAMQAAGIDVDRLNKDLAAHDADITALLQRTLSQADAMHLQGTPVFLIGPFIKAQELDFAGFRQAVSDARARQSGGSPMKGKP